MGVPKLWELVEPAGSEIDLNTLKGKVLAIDASIWIYSFLISLKGDKNEVVPNAHLLGFFRHEEGLKRQFLIMNGFNKDSIDSDDFRALPADLQLEVLKQLKVDREIEDKMTIFMTPKTPIDFSKRQLGSLLDKGKITRQIYTVRESMEAHGESTSTSGNTTVIFQKRTPSKNNQDNNNDNGTPSSSQQSQSSSQQTSSQQSSSDNNNSKKSPPLSLTSKITNNMKTTTSPSSSFFTTPPKPSPSPVSTHSLFQQQKQPINLDFDQDITFNDNSNNDNSFQIEDDDENGDISFTSESNNNDDGFSLLDESFEYIKKKDVESETIKKSHLIPIGNIAIITDRNTTSPTPPSISPLSTTTTTTTTIDEDNHKSTTTNKSSPPTLDTSESTNNATQLPTKPVPRTTVSGKTLISKRIVSGGFGGIGKSSIFNNDTGSRSNIQQSDLETNITKNTSEKNTISKRETVNEKEHYSIDYGSPETYNEPLDIDNFGESHNNSNNDVDENIIDEEQLQILNDIVSNNSKNSSSKNKTSTSTTTTTTTTTTTKININNSSHQPIDIDSIFDDDDDDELLKNNNNNSISKVSGFEIDGDDIKRVGSKIQFEEDDQDLESIDKPKRKEISNTEDLEEENQDEDEPFLSSIVQDEFAKKNNSTPTKKTFFQDELLLSEGEEDNPNNSSFILPYFTSNEREKLEKELQLETVNVTNQINNQTRNLKTLNEDILSECHQLLGLFGIPYITSPTEAEAQCAELYRLKLVDGIVTDDSDVLLFGDRDTVVYKYMFNKKHKPQRFCTTDIQTKLGLTRDMLINIALLLGCDYTMGVKGIGIINAVEIINEFDNDLVAFKQFINGDDEDEKGKKKKKNNKLQALKKKKIKLDASFPSDLVKNAFLKPDVDSSNTHFTWNMPDIKELNQLAKDKFGWPVPKTETILYPIVSNLDYEDANKRALCLNQFNRNHVYMADDDSSSGPVDYLDVDPKMTQNLFSILINKGIPLQTKLKSKRLNDALSGLSRKTNNIDFNNEDKEKVKKSKSLSTSKVAPKKKTTQKKRKSEESSTKSSKKSK
eukprot:gene7394-9086_t